jgi:hypothetical protein
VFPEIADSYYSQISRVVTQPTHKYPNATLYLHGRTIHILIIIVGLQPLHSSCSIRAKLMRGDDVLLLVQNHRDGR